jgi:hypothetical protein
VRKFLILLLIIFGVIVFAYGVYLIFGRPPIPLPAYHYSVQEDNQLYDIIKATESDEVTVTLATNGEIAALTDEISLMYITYTPNSLSNTVSLASKYIIPPETQNTISTISKCPLVRFIPKVFVNFFYHVIRFRITVVFVAN